MQEEGATPEVDVSGQATVAVEGPPRETDPAPRAVSLDAGASIGRYLILEQVGTGGMGSVYAAYDPELDRKIAVKILHRDTGDAEAAARMQREAQAMARLSHQNVVSVHDVGTFDGRVFLAMEFVDGATAKGWLAAAPRTIPEILDVYAKAARGLAAAHAAGLVHRDFKPTNVMVGRDGRVRVADFGLARAAADAPSLSSSGVTGPNASLDGALHDSAESLSSSSVDVSRGSLSANLTVTGTVMGTPAYMSPEQHLGRPADPRTDQFAFCIALWEAVYGKRPFRGKTLQEIRKSVLRGALRTLPRDTKVPGTIHKALRRGLDPNPEQRFPDMDALLAALLRDPARRRRTVAVAVGAALLIAGGGYAAANLRSDPCSGAADPIAQVWSPERAAAVAAAISATKVPFAEHAASTVSATLEAYGAALATSRTDACEDTNVRGEASPLAMDLRMACIDARAAELNSLATLLESADAALAERSIAAANGLSSLAECEDLDVLRGGAAPPTDPVTRDAIKQVREGLAHARALSLAGNFNEAVEQAAKAVEQANAAAYDPVRAEALKELGAMQGEGPSPKDATATLQEAVAIAEISGADPIRARALIELIRSLAMIDGATRRARLIAGLAHAATKRAKLGRQDQARLLVYEAYIDEKEQHHEAARDKYLKALEFERELGLSDNETANTLGALAGVESSMGRSEVALDYHQQALAAREKALGGRHPDVASSLNNTAIVLTHMGRDKEALELYERSAQIMKDMLGPEHPHYAVALGNIAVALTNAGQHEAALAYHQKAVPIVAKAFGEDHVNYAMFVTNLANVYRDMHRHEDAMRLYEQCVQILTKAIGDESSDLATVIHNMGMVHGNAGRLHEAVAAYERSYEMRASLFGADSLMAAYSLTSLGEARLDAGDRERALGELERTLVIFEREEADSMDLGLVRFALARALITDAAEAKRARSLAEAAREDYAAMDPASPHNNGAAVRKWLRQHPSPSP